MALPRVAILYAREDSEFVGRLVGALGALGVDVWWDQLIGNTAQFRTQIYAALESADILIPVWSHNSRDSDFVLDEADYGRRLHKGFIPVTIDTEGAPLGHGQMQTHNLSSWDGRNDDPRIARLVVALKEVRAEFGARSDGATARLYQRDGRLVAARPWFVASVSSHEVPIEPADCLLAALMVRYEAVLVSAYDVKADPKGRLADVAYRCGESGAVVYLDSGRYESNRKEDALWTRESFLEAALKVRWDLAFAFDDARTSALTSEDLAQEVIQRAKQDTRDLGRAVIPIVHAPKGYDGSFRADLLPEAFRRVAQELRPPAIAVPERELGDGILSSAQVVSEIRRSLNDMRSYQPIHVLGAGNPLSIAVLASAGADSFDGLEWCRTSIDHQTARLYHYRQYDWFQYQTRLSESGFVRKQVDNPKLSPFARMLLHNLDFFREWMTRMRRHCESNSTLKFLREVLPAGACEDLDSLLPGVFK